MASSSSRSAAGEEIAVVTDEAGAVHYASAASPFVVGGLAKGTLKPAKAAASTASGSGSSSGSDGAGTS